MDLRVWWIPQIPMTAFRYPVRTIAEGALLLDALAKYDLFQLEHNVKPDYCNVGGLQMLIDGEWIDWEDPETGADDPIAFMADQAAALEEAGQ